MSSEPARRPAIEIRGLGKDYRIGGAQSTNRTLREVLAGSASAAMGSLQSLVGSGSRPSRPKTSFWALRDLTFDVGEGEVLGVIGRNGAGKSTLLKILSRISEPTVGHADLHGRVGSLLEVGTGFHSELTGRENIFLSGAILGMRRAEIARNFDAIVDFAEVGAFLDTPVKHYSSGMYMKLAFAVAAHLEPEILIVDEVLAVGDAAFQRKCIGKMGSVAREGRTVLFVSHNMGAILGLCTRCVLLEKGRVALDADPVSVATRYQASLSSSSEDTTDLSTAEHYGSGRARFTSLAVSPRSSDGEPRAFLRTGDRLHVETRLVAHSAVEGANVCVVLYDAAGYRLVDVNTALQGRFLTLAPGDEARVEFELERVLLKPGPYLLGLWIGRGGLEDIDGILYATTLIVEPDPGRLRHSEVFPGPYQCEFSHSVRIAPLHAPASAAAGELATQAAS